MVLDQPASSPRLLDRITGPLAHRRIRARSSNAV